MIRMRSGDACRMLAHARSCLPGEACGMLGGREEQGVRHVEAVYCLTNQDASREHFSMDPREQLAAVRDMRARGIQPLGNWHSHPETPSRPSAEDVRLAYDPAASYLILSLEAEDFPTLNAFRIREGKYEWEILELYD